jgi:hypothetical protein
MIGGSVALWTLLAAAADVPPCFELEVSRDSLVTIVHADDSVVPTSSDADGRVVRIERLDAGGTIDLSLDRVIMPGERTFEFMFARQDVKYRLTPLAEDDTPLPTCIPITLTAPATKEASPPLFATAVIGLSDGWGIQYGGALWVKRFGVAGSVLPSVPGDTTWTYDVEVAWRGNRGIGGVGYRRRHGVTEGAERLAYVHFGLELPGVRLLSTTWSSWMGLEFRPVTRKPFENDWDWDPGFGFRLQLRWRRDQWVNPPEVEAP